jgi:LacI family transcriptional regulator
LGRFPWEVTHARHTTIKDVAKKAGVSITTVSSCSTNARRVISAEVRKRVLEAAKELEYHPSALAAGLAGSARTT